MTPRQSVRAPPPVRTATAVVGSVGTRTDTAWFRTLDKPSWYPDPAVFPIAWTALYATIAWSATRALNRVRGPERTAVARGLGQNLVLNAGWTWAFFRAQRPGPALATVLALDASNVSLLRRVGRVDAPAGVALLPYLAWTAFATALTEEIWYRKRPGLTRCRCRCRCRCLRWSEPAPQRAGTA